jgi:hypothetical protein
MYVLIVVLSVLVITIHLCKFYHGSTAGGDDAGVYVVNTDGLIPNCVVGKRGVCGNKETFAEF